MILLAYILLTILAATTDALFFNGNKKPSKLVESFFQGLLILVPILYKPNFDIWYLINILIMYACIRIAIFDLTFNLITKLGINYVGTTTYLYDKIMNQIKDVWFWVARLFFLFVAVLIYYITIK